MGKILWFIILFLIVGAFLIIKDYHLNLKEPGDRKTFIEEFINWIFHLTKNIKEIIGYAVHQDWLPKINETNQTE